MVLPKSCCCCVSLEAGCFALSLLSIIGHASVMIDTILGYDNINKFLVEDRKFIQ